MITLIVALLIQFGYLSSPAEWNSLDVTQQQDMRGKVINRDITLYEMV
jgi:hypothetical protein